VGRILRKLKRLRLQSLYRGDRAMESERSVEDTDALAAGYTTGAPGVANAMVPPNYVKDDDGRPLH
jgi:hypothetical protein